MNNLSPEIFNNIFQNLETEDIINFISTCQSFNKIIEDNKINIQEITLKKCNYKFLIKIFENKKIMKVKVSNIINLDKDIYRFLFNKTNIKFKKNVKVDLKNYLLI